MAGSSAEGLSAAEARRLALAAQGLAAAPSKLPGRAAVLRVARDLQALQIDTVNVLARAHYLPLYSRLGPYATEHLDRLTNETHDLIETREGHQASYVPVELEPYLRWRRTGTGNAWRSTWRGAIDPAFIDAVEHQVIERGPLALGDLDDPRRRAKPAPHELTIRRKDGKPYAESSLRWGRPSDGKTVLDGLLHEGRLTLAGRRSGMDRLYDLTERVVPKAILDTPTPDPVEARRELVRRAGRALGVATVADLANYFLLKIGETKAAAHELVDAGELVPTAVEGWKGPTFRWSSAKAPRRTTNHSLVGPFDSLTWSRDRTLRLFGFEFSFEIYVPEAKRRYGYYVLPFLQGDRLTARVDLRADRTSRVLHARSFAEADDSLDEAALRSELERMAEWLGLDDLRSERVR